MIIIINNGKGKAPHGMRLAKWQDCRSKGQQPKHLVFTYNSIDNFGISWTCFVSSGAQLC